MIADEAVAENLHFAHHACARNLLAATMEAMRESWTDARLDDFGDHIDRRFDAVDHRFDAVDQRFDAVDQRFKAVDQRFDSLERRMESGFGRVDVELHRINDRLDAMHRLMLQTVVAMSGATIAGFVAVAGLILTQ